MKKFPSLWYNLKIGIMKTVPQSRKEEIQSRKAKIEQYQKALLTAKTKKDRRWYTNALAIHKDNIGMELTEEENLSLSKIEKSIIVTAKTRGVI